MAKGQVRSNREVKKPKKEKPKTSAAAPSSFIVVPGKQNPTKGSAGK